MPSEGGFDSYTVSLFKKQLNHNPPENHKEESWIRWRTYQLSAFGKRVYKKVKSLNSEVQVSWAPSIYPWSEEEYFQSWSNWIKGGYADFIIPQFYRYKLEDYKKIIDQIENQLEPKEKQKVFADVLTALASGYRINDTFMVDMVNFKRS